MKKTEIRNLLLALFLGLLGLMCVGLLPSALLWALVDIEDHLQAQTTFLAAAMTAIIGALSLDAFMVVMRFGVLLAKTGIVSRIYAILHMLMRVIFGICNALILLTGVACVGMSNLQPAVCAFALLMLAVMIGGYMLVFRLEKRLKAKGQTVR